MTLGSTTLHCRNLNVGWFSPYLPIFRVVEWTYIYHSKLVDFRRRYQIQGHPSSLEVQVRLGWFEGGMREGPPSSTPNTSIHPPNRPQSKMVSLQYATRLLFITFFMEKKLKTPPFIGIILLRRAPIPSTIPPEHSQVFSQGKDQQWPKRNKKVTKRRRYAK